MKGLLSITAAVILATVAGVGAAPIIEVDFSDNSTGDLVGQSATVSGDGLTGAWSKYQDSSYNKIEIEGADKELKVYRDNKKAWECRAEADVDSSLPAPITADGEGFYLGFNIRFEGDGMADGGVRLAAGSNELLVAGALEGEFVAGSLHSGGLQYNQPLYSGQAVTAGTDYLLIAKFTDNESGYDDRIQLWIDPSSESDTPVMDEMVTSEITNWQGAKITSIGIGDLDDLVNSEPTVYVDNVRVGSSFADVVPEPATMSLLAIGGLGVLIRRRKA